MGSAWQDIRWGPRKLAKRPAVRAALVRSRAKETRQNLAGKAHSGLIGGTIRPGVAYSLLLLFHSNACERISCLQLASLDTGAVLTVTGVVLALGTWFGLETAILSPAEELWRGKETRQTSGGLVRQRLVASQVAISLIGLAGARLLFSGMSKMRSASLGEYRYGKSECQMTFFEELETRLRQTHCFCLPARIAETA